MQLRVGVAQNSVLFDALWRKHHICVSANDDVPVLVRDQLGQHLVALDGLGHLSVDHCHQAHMHGEFHIKQLIVPWMQIDLSWVESGDLLVVGLEICTVDSDESEGLA